MERSFVRTWIQTKRWTPCTVSPPGSCLMLASGDQCVFVHVAGKMPAPSSAPPRNPFLGPPPQTMAGIVEWARWMMGDGQRRRRAHNCRLIDSAAMPGPRCYLNAEQMLAHARNWPHQQYHPNNVPIPFQQRPNNIRNTIPQLARESAPAFISY